MKKAKQEIIGRKGPEQVKPFNFEVFRLPLRIVSKEERFAKRQP